MSVTVQTKACQVCDKTSIVTMTEAEWEEFSKHMGRFVQDIFPHLSAGERELLISGTHPACWESLFGSDEE